MNKDDDSDISLPMIECPSLSTTQIIRIKDLRQHRHLLSKKMPDILERAFSMVLTDNKADTNVDVMNKLISTYFPPQRPHTIVETELQFDEALLDSIEGCNTLVTKVISLASLGKISLEEKECYLTALTQKLRFLELRDVESEIAKLMSKVGEG